MASISSIIQNVQRLNSTPHEGLEEINYISDMDSEQFNEDERNEKGVFQDQIQTSTEHTPNAHLKKENLSDTDEN